MASERKPTLQNGRRSPTENLVIATICEVMEVDDVPTDVSFFSLGADSVKIARVVQELRRRMDLDLPLRLFFMSPTVEGVAAQIDGFQVQEALRRRIPESDQPRETGTI